MWGNFGTVVVASRGVVGSGMFWMVYTIHTHNSAHVSTEGKVLECFHGGISLCFDMCKCGWGIRESLFICERRRDIYALT